MAAAIVTVAAAMVAAVPMVMAAAIEVVVARAVVAVEPAEERPVGVVIVTGVARAIVPVVLAIPIVAAITRIKRHADPVGADIDADIGARRRRFGKAERGRGQSRRTECNRSQ